MRIVIAIVIVILVIIVLRVIIVIVVIMVIIEIVVRIDIIVVFFIAIIVINVIIAIVVRVIPHYLIPCSVAGQREHRARSRGLAHCLQRPYFNQEFQLCTRYWIPRPLKGALWP